MERIKPFKRGAFFVREPPRACLFYLVFITAVRLILAAGQSFSSETTGDIEIYATLAIKDSITKGRGRGGERERERERERGREKEKLRGGKRERRRKREGRK